MSTGAPGSSVGVDQIPTASVFLEPTRAGWVVRVGAVALASGGWESAEAAVVKADHKDAVVRKALTSLTGKAPKSPGSPGRAWPLPITSVTVLLTDLAAALAEHTEAATAWWHNHDVDLAEGDFPWLVCVSDIHVTPSTGRDVGTVGRLHGLGSLGFVLGTLTGRYPASVVISCPDAETRHRAHGPKMMPRYWPKNLRGVVPNSKSPLGRAAFTVGGDSAQAFVETYGLVLPSRVLQAPVVMPARTPANVVVVDRDAYMPAAPVTVGRNGGAPATPAAEPAIGRSVPAVNTVSPEDRYRDALLAHVHAALAGSGDATPTDVLRAAAVAVVATPTPHGVTRRTPPGVALAAITQGHTAPHLNLGPEKVRESLQAAMN
jgi:hypothetical protein